MSILRFYQFQAVILKENYERAKKDMASALKVLFQEFRLTFCKLVKRYSEKVSQNDPFRPYVDTIIAKCPPEYKDVTRGDGDADLTWSSLTNLNKKVNNIEHDLSRAKVYLLSSILLTA
jgi:hypothetical protein